MPGEADETYIVQLVTKAQDAIKEAEAFRAKIEAVKAQMRELAAASGQALKDVAVGMKKAFARQELGKLGPLDVKGTETYAQSLSKIREFSNLVNIALGEATKTATSGFASAGQAAALMTNQVANMQRQILQLAQAQNISLPQAAQALKAIGNNATNVNTALKQLNQEYKAIVAITNVHKASLAASAQVMTQANKWMQSLGTVGRYLFGGVLGFTAVTALRDVINLFKMAAREGQEWAQTLYKLSVSVRLLQNLGMEITFQESLKTVQELKREFGIFTTMGLTQGVAQIQLLMRNFQFTKEEMKEVVRLSAALATVQGKDISEAARELALFFSSGYAESLQRAGFAVNRVTVQHEAMRMGLFKSYLQLTEVERAHAGLSLVMKQAGDLTKLATEYQETASGKVDTAKNRWSELWKVVGLKMNPALAVLGSLLIKVIDGLLILDGVFRLFVTGTLSTLIAGFMTSSDAVKMFWEALQGKEVGGVDAIIQKFYENMARIQGVLHKIAFPELVDPLKTQAEAALDAAKMMAEQEAVAILEAFDRLRQEIIEEQLRLQRDLKKLETDLQRDLAEIDEDGAQRRDELWRDYYRRISDLDTDLARDIAKAERDLQSDLADIDRDAAQDRAEAERKFRDDDLEAERDYQRDMRRLRDRYLFDLEDAVRARDAKQIRSLARRFQFDRDRLRKDFKDDAEERKIRFQEEIEDIERQRQRRRQERMIDHQQQLADLRLQHAQRRQEAWIAFQQELADLAEQLEQKRADRLEKYRQEIQDAKDASRDRLKAVAESLVLEQGLTEKGARRIYSLLYDYFGPGGAVEDIYRYLLQSIAQMESIIDRGLQKRYDHRYAREIPPPPGRGYAEGGSFVAMKPIRRMFGERGPELVTAIPLTRAGHDVGKLMEAPAMTMGGSGRLAIQIMLSPGLEGKIVKQSLDALGDVLVEIERAR